MKKIIRKILSLLAEIISFIWFLFPFKIRKFIILGFIFVESRGKFKSSLIRIFEISDFLEDIVNERSLKYGNGIHPKHELMKYHDYFVERIKNGSKVLDIGCGYGAVAFSIASKVPGVKVLGIDFDRDRLDQAKKNNNFKNLDFIYGDATKSIPEGPWDVVVLSNVLEHIEDRILFLTQIIKLSQCKKILIRVPSFERKWTVPFRKKLGIYYFNDTTHFIEHTLEEFRTEMKQSNLDIIEIKTLWGEIWSECHVK